MDPVIPWLALYMTESWDFEPVPQALLDSELELSLES
jgi:hypothetical protein